MIAAFILLICAAPTIHTFTGIYLEEKKLARSHQKHHFAMLAYANLIEQLYKGEIAIEYFNKKDKETIDISKFDETYKKAGLQAHYQLSELDSHKPKGYPQPIKYLLSLDLFIEEKRPEKPLDKIKTKKPDLSRLVYIEVGVSKTEQGINSNETEEQVESNEENEADS